VAVPGTGIDTGVYGLDINSSGEVSAVGNFSSAGGTNTERAAIGNGSTWVNADIKIDAPDFYLSCVLYTPSGDVYAGCGTNLGAGTLNFSGLTTVNNSGSAEVRPVLYIKGPGTLRRLENQTSKKIVYIDLTILTNEEVFIDFGKGKAYSSIRGDLSYAIIPGSDFADFSLMPGDNKIAAFMYNDMAAVMQLSYQPQHWSADATVKAETLP